VILSGTPTSVRNFITIRLLLFAFEDAHQVTRIAFLGEWCSDVTAPIFIINTSNDVISCKYAFCGHENDILHFDPIPPKKLLGQFVYIFLISAFVFVYCLFFVCYVLFYSMLPLLGIDNILG